MESVYNIHPLKIKPLKEKINFNYDFLSNEYAYVYYNLINSLDDYKFKNLYRFIYLKLLKMNRVFETIEKLLVKKNISPYEFNDILKNYINNNVLEIIITNTIQLYFI